MGEPAAYIALGTRQRTPEGKNVVGPPYNVYGIGEVVYKMTRISYDLKGTPVEDIFNEDFRKEIRGIVGRPPFYRVDGVKDDELVLEEVAEGSIEFGKLQKWVGDANTAQRGLLNHSGAALTKEQVVELLSN